MSIIDAKESFRSKKFGVFNHFIFNGMNWNGRCDMFDVNYVAETLHSIGAGYYGITIMQASRCLAAPNKTYDEIAGTRPGEACCRRDLIAELSEALGKYGIDLLIYFSADGPWNDPEVGERFGFKAPREHMTLPFVEKWAAVIEEYSRRYGDAVKAWWVDSCYEWFDCDEEKMSYYDRAIRSGNPDALIAFNRGVKDEIMRFHKSENFTAGEFCDFTYIPKSGDTDGLLSHVFVPLGIGDEGKPWTDWLRPGCKRSGEYMRDYVRAVNSLGGIVTVDIHISGDCKFDPEQIKCLSHIYG